MVLSPGWAVVVKFPGTESSYLPPFIVERFILPWLKLHTGNAHTDICVMLVVFVRSWLLEFTFGDYPAC